MKFQIVEIAMKEGYDFISARDMVSNIIKDLQTKAVGFHTYVINNKSIQIKKVGV